MAQLGAGDVITFDPGVFPPDSPQTIALNNALPVIVTDTVTIDGSNAGVILDGSGTPEWTTGGLVIDNASGVVVKGLQILNFPYNGVVLRNGASNNIIGGMNATPGGSCTGDCNLISGNGWDGVDIEGAGTMNNIVSGNYIGTNVSGTAALGNANSGVGIGNGATYNVIGGDTPGERNLISGNLDGGVGIGGSGTEGNTVSGNYIGTDASGTSAISNGYTGLRIGDGAAYNVIGGDTPGERNVISGSGGHGVKITDSGTVYNIVSGNYIGTDASGTSAIGNAESGVTIARGAQSNLITSNLISGNNREGLVIGDDGTMYNTVSGNYIGTDASGTFAIGNGRHGVSVRGSAAYNLIGGDTPGERNLISGNGGGVDLSWSAMSNTVSGNYIGMDISGTKALSNEVGVTISLGAQHNVIGGTTEGERNIISGHNENGLAIKGSGTMHNIVSGNYIGTDASGMADLGNAWDGVIIWGGATHNVIGGDTPGKRNIISGNGQAGVTIYASGTMSNTVSGNYIGTDANGMAALGNMENGVKISESAQYNVIGGDTPGERNIISGNNGNGVRIYGSTTNSNTVSGNYIGTKVNGTTALGNGGDGIKITDGPQYNVIGGSNATPGGACSGECNLISGNNENGVRIYGSTTNSNTVSGNYIGTNVSGTAAIGNVKSGVVIGAQYNLIGGDTPEERNIISGNGKHGVHVMGSGTMHNTVSGNYIGTDAAGTGDLANNSDGVLLYGNAQRNTIGPDNTIAYNGRFGVLIVGPTCLSNTITENSIHSNTEKGILLYDGGNLELSPPTITDRSSDTVSGTAPPNSIVEIFSDDEDEGRVYEGSTPADGAGNLAFNKSGGFTLSNVTATATDVDGNTSEFSNVPPTVGAITAPLDPVQLGTEVNVSADFTDPNSEDTHTAVWDWGDGITTEGTVTDHTISDSHIYETPGVYTIKLTVTDNHGGVGSAVYQFVVVYDPEGGFVTGGGWINSPEGAYALDPLLTGRATFGFVAKYKKGADAPTGETEFRFRVADLNFHSDAYQWLVMAGPKAQFKGDGTINGAGNYGFMLTAIDAALTPSTDEDLFCIKIWDKYNGEAIVYDNQMGDSDDADPTTAIGGGSIVVHKEK
jgi:titin